MFKKIELWIVCLLIIFFFIILVLYGGILRHSHLGGQKFKFVQSAAVFVSEIPHNIKKIFQISNDQGYYFLDKTGRFVEKSQSKILSNDRTDGLLLLSRYNRDEGKSMVEVIDLKNYEIIHKYSPSTEKILNSFDYKGNNELKEQKFNLSKNRFYMWHPLLDNKGNIIFNATSPLFKIGFCGDILWTNAENLYHHSIEKDHQDNIWVPSLLNPNLIKEKNFNDYKGDDGISQISSNGKIIFEKSVIQILIDNGYKHLLFSQLNYSGDVIHLNDIEPVLNDGEYWKKGDVFLSIRNLSMIVLYRPSTNEIIKMLRSPNFSFQHDVDILDKKTISIFNNNLYNTSKGQRIFTTSEIIGYDFEEDKYFKIHNSSMKKYNMKTNFGGLYQRLNDGSYMIEEQEHGRIMLFNSNDDLIWEYVNKSDDGKVYVLRWSRIIQDEKIIKNFKKLVETKKCIN